MEAGVPAFAPEPAPEIPAAQLVPGLQPAAEEARHMDVPSEEKESHVLTHVPYQAWCRLCVSSRAPDAPHRTVPTLRVEMD